MNDELDPRLRGVGETPPDLDALFHDLREQVRSAASPVARIREQPAWRRRLFGLALALTIVVGAGVSKLRPDIGDYPPLLLAAYLVSLSVLLCLAIHIGLRPVHQLELPRVARAGLLLTVVAATVTLAVVPGMHAHAIAPPAPWALTSHVPACLGYGFLVGIPVYAALRLLARDSAGRLMAAAAAGLVGNLALELHCPVGGPQHLVLGHVGVLVVYLTGVFAIDRFLSRD